MHKKITIEEEEETPQEARFVAGPIVGWRAWRQRRQGFLRRRALYSVFFDYQWTPGVLNPASCAMIEEGGDSNASAPIKTCFCGFWAWKTLEQCEQNVREFMSDPNNSYDVCPPLVFGPVNLWGRVIEHASGYRAEWAEPVWEKLQWPSRWWPSGW